jgi:hypothetical protein
MGETVGGLGERRKGVEVVAWAVFVADASRVGVIGR